MNEETVAADYPSVGERLRAAREEKGFSLEDIAAETRIPRRHLQSLEEADWDRLPAPTYSIGFAKSYASAVGLDRMEIGDQLRAEMGGYRGDTATIDHFEPVDPARTMPKWLVLSALAGIVVVILIFTWIRNQSLEPAPVSEPATAEQPAQAPVGAPMTPPAAQPSAPAQGPVVLTATAPAWIQVKDQGKTLFEGLLQPGQTYQVPPTAIAPTLKAGAPQALRVNVGTAVAPPVGPAGQVASNVSLKPADLMRAPGAAPAPDPAASPPQNVAPAEQNSLAQ